MLLLHGVLIDVAVKQVSVRSFFPGFFLETGKWYYVRDDRPR